MSPLEMAQFLVEEKQFKAEVKGFFVDEKEFKSEVKTSLVTVSTRINEVNTKFDLLRGTTIPSLFSLFSSFLLFFFAAPIIKGDQNITGVQILQTIHQLVEDNTKMGDELKDKNDKIENLRQQINEIHKKNERYVGGSKREREVCWREQERTEEAIIIKEIRDNKLTIYFI
jgi:hypothetical protein